jgi:lipoprotein-anchoring transpeptidase ErfK/SrfK
MDMKKTTKIASIVLAIVLMGIPATAGAITKSTILTRTQPPVTAAPEYAPIPAGDDIAPTSDDTALATDPVYADKSVAPLYPFTAGKDDLPVVYDMPYVIGVDTVNQVITVVAKGTSGAYDTPVKHFICSTGTATDPTPTGSYILPSIERYDWLYFRTYSCWVRYPVNIFGNYFFHSLIYNSKSVDSLSMTSLRKLGTPASHGCIRMLDSDVQWLSENVFGGTMVIVYEGASDPALNAALRPAYQ